MNRAIIIIFLIIFSGGATFMIMASKRPHTLGISVSSHIVSPAIKQATMNGRTIIQQSIKGRSETGGAHYQNSRSDALNFKIAWYDILDDQSYYADFTVGARELSTFSGIGEVADISIIVGPGADISVFTPDPEEMRLIGLRLERELRALGHPPPVLVRELCAGVLATDDPMAIKLSTFYKDYIETGRDTSSSHLERTLRQRQRHINENGLTVPRCTNDGLD